MSDTIEMLRKVPMFAELDEDELTWVADLASGFEVPAGLPPTSWCETGVTAKPSFSHTAAAAPRSGTKCAR